MAQKKKKINKYYNLDENIDTSVSFKTVIFTIIGVALFIGVIYGLTVLLNMRDEKRPEAPEASISYDKILAGSTLTRNEDEYYVIFYKYDTDIYDAMAKYRSEEKEKVYYVDLDEGLNKYVISNEVKTDVSSAEDLRVKDPTLVVVKDHKITDRKIGKKDIIDYLS